MAPDYLEPMLYSPLSLLSFLWIFCFASLGPDDSSIHNFIVRQDTDREAVEISFELDPSVFSGELLVKRFDGSGLDEALVKKLNFSDLSDYLQDGKVRIYDEFVNQGQNYKYVLIHEKNGQQVGQLVTDISINFTSELKARSFYNSSRKMLEIEVQSDRAGELMFELLDVSDVRIFFWLPRKIEAGKHLINLPMIEFKPGKYSLHIISEETGIRQLVVIP